MKDTMDRLWDEYLVDECAKIDTDEERRLSGRAAELGEAVSRLLSAEQGEALEAYVDSLLDAESFLSPEDLLVRLPSAIPVSSF